MSASAVQTLIDNALAVALNKSYAAASFSDSAIASVTSLMPQIENPPTYANSLEAPSLEKPLTQDSAIEYKSEYDALAGELTDQLSGIFSGFLDKYFPPAGFHLDKVEEWIGAALTDGGTGIPANVESQIWQRGRDKEALESARLSYEAVGSFAARGFMLPPGAMAGRLMEVQQDAANKNSSFGRDVAIKQIEIEIENIRFAISAAIDARMRGIQAAAEYWKAYLSPQDIAARRAGAIADARINFSNALSSWFSAQSSLYGQEVSLLQHEWSNKTSVYGSNISARTGFTQSIANVSSNAAKAQSDIASAAMSAMNTLAQVGYSENKTV